MGNENLETIVYVEQGGGVTIFKTNHDDKPYLTKESVHLCSGYNVLLTKIGRAKLKVAGSLEQEYIRVLEMEIYNFNNYKTIYKEKTIQAITMG